MGLALTARGIRCSRFQGETECRLSRDRLGLALPSPWQIGFLRRGSSCRKDISTVTAACPRGASAASELFFALENVACCYFLLTGADDAESDSGLRRDGRDAGDRRPRLP